MVYSPDAARGRNVNERPIYGMRIGLGEHNSDLQGVTLEASTNFENAVRLNVGSTADQRIAGALAAEMVKSGKFLPDAKNGVNAFDYVGKEAPRDAIYEIMRTPEMQRIVEAQRPAMEAAAAGREAQRQKDDEERFAQMQKDQVALADAQAKLDSI